MTDWRTRNARAVLREFQAHGLADHIRLHRYAGQDLTGEVFAPDEDLAGANFRNADLTDARLSRVRLAGADLRGATLDGATLDGATLAGADLTGADLSGARLDRASLIDADVTSARVERARWDLARLTGARLPADAVIAGWGTAIPGLVPRLELAPGDGSSADFAWHPAGQLLAAAHGHAVMLWDLVTGKAIAVLTAHQRSVRAVAFSPDGTRLATADSDGTVIVWDTSTATPTATLTTHQAPVNAVAFSPDGTRLATASDDGTICLWDTSTAAEGHRDSAQPTSPRRVQPVVTLLPLRTGGWAVFRGEHEYELHGEPDGTFWWRAGLCRFEPGEMDGYGVRNVTPGSGTRPGSIATDNPAGEGS